MSLKDLFQKEASIWHEVAIEVWDTITAEKIKMKKIEAEEKIKMKKIEALSAVYQKSLDSKPLIIRQKKTEIPRKELIDELRELREIASELSITLRNI